MDVSSFYTQLIGIGALMVGSAFFSSSETALMASSKPKLHTYEKQGKKAAKRVANMLEDPEKLLATLLLGNNLVNIAASALATKVMLDMFGAAGLAYATLGMTFLVLIFAEVLPKTLAARYPEAMAMFYSLPLVILIKVLNPFTKLISIITRAMIFAMGLGGRSHEPNFGEDDVRGAIGLGLHHGVLEKSERRMLDSILELDILTVEEVMTHRSQINSLDISLPNEKLFDMVSLSTHSRLPVWEDNPDNIIGIIHVKDFYRAYKECQQSKQKFDIRNIMQAPYFVPEQAIVSDQLLEFRRQRKHMGLVIDEYGDIMGVITLEDILEEIVGEIEDEHDEIRPTFIRQKDGSVILPGSFPLRDANREFDWHLPDDEESVTVGGLLIENAERIPEVGEKLYIEGYVFEVMAKRRQAITRVKVSPRKGHVADDE